MLKPSLAPVAQGSCWSARVGPAQQVSRLVQGLDGPGTDIGDLGQSGEFERVEDVCLGLQRVPRRAGLRHRQAFAVPVGWDESEVFGDAAGQLVQGTPVYGVRPEHLPGFPAGEPLLVAGQAGSVSSGCPVERLSHLRPGEMAGVPPGAEHDVRDLLRH